MADAKSLQNRKLECTICYKTYNKPKILECMHSFCEACIDGLEKKQETKCPSCNKVTKRNPNVANHYNHCNHCGCYRAAGNFECGHAICNTCSRSGYYPAISSLDSIACPECCEKSSLPKEGAISLPTNFVIERDLEMKKRAKMTAECQDCVSQAAATDYCEDCHLDLCSDCTKYHKKSLKFSRHQIVNIKQAPQERMVTTNRYCEEHEELLKYFCENCKRSVCSDCQISSAHRGHQISLVSEVQKKVKEDLSSKIKEAESVKAIFDGNVKSGKEFLKQIKIEDGKSIELVKEIFEEAKEALMKRRDEVIQQIATQSNTASFDEFQKSSRTLNDMLKYVKSIDCSNVEINSTLIGQLQKSLEKIGWKGNLSTHANGFKAPVANPFNSGGNQQYLIRNANSQDQSLSSTTSTKSFVLYKRHRIKSPNYKTGIENVMKNICTI